MHLLELILTFTASILTKTYAVMKKILAFVFAIFISIAAHVHAVPVYNLITKITTEKDAPKSPEIKVETTKDGYKVTLNLEEVVFRADDVYGGRYFIDIDGFGQTCETKQPSLPLRVESFFLPEGKLADIEVVSSQYVDIVRQLAPGRMPLRETEENYTKVTLPDITSFSGFTTNELVKVEEIVTYRGNKFVRVGITPARFSKTSGTSRIFKNIVFNITLFDAPATDSFSNNIFTNWISDSQFGQNHLFNDDLYNNGNMVEPDGDIAKDYLIVTPSEFSSVALTFIDWKKQEGYNCYIIECNNLTAQQVKDNIIDFASEHPKFYALLIIGDSTLIPTWDDSQNGVDATDAPYACLEGKTDTYPDVLYGRIPVKTLADATKVIDKIVNYEKIGILTQYPTLELKIQKGLHVGYFQHVVNNPSRESRAFIKTNEEIISMLTPYNIDITRLYWAASNVNPRYLQNGLELPTELQRPQYSWTFTPANVNSAINSRISYVLFRGHGNDKGWYSSGNLYCSDDITSLNNSFWQPVVFSIACSNGENLNDSCFAARFLNISAKAGASGIWTATLPSYSEPNDNYAKDLFRFLYNMPEENEVFPSWCNIGEAIGYAKQKLYSYWSPTICKFQANIYHWLGDPTMCMVTQNPTKILGVGVSYDRLFTKISCGEDDIKITAILKDGKVQSYAAKSVFFQTSKCEYIVLTGKNKIPKVITFDNDIDRGSNRLTSLNSVYYSNDVLRVNYTLSSYDLLPGLETIYGTPGTVTVSSINGRVMGSYSCPYNDQQITIDCSSYPTGTYIVSLKFCGVDGGSATFIK